MAAGSPRSPFPGDLTEFVVREVARTGWAVHARIVVARAGRGGARPDQPGGRHRRAVERRPSVLVTGGDSLEVVAVWIGMLGLDFTVESPAALVDHLQVLADRYAGGGRRQRRLSGSRRRKLGCWLSTTRHRVASMTRPVDARTDQYVEEVVALDPLTATFAGIAGHDDKLPDLTPAGFDAVEELNRRALAEVAALEPSDDRERVAKEAFLERVGLEVEKAEAGFERSAVSVISSGVHAMREVFDLMPTDTEEDWQTIGDRLAAVPTPSPATARRSRPRRRPAGSPRGGSTSRSPARSAAGPARRARPATTSATSSRKRPTGCATGWRRSPRRHRRRTPSSGGSAETDLAPRGREVDGGRGVSATQLASRYFLGAEVDLEETYAWGFEELERIEDEMETVAASGSSRAVPSTTPSRRSTLDPARDCGNGGVRGLDAGAGRHEPRRASTAPTSTSPSRSAPSSASVAPTNDGGDLLHRP